MVPFVMWYDSGVSKYTIGPLFDKTYPVTQFYGANPDYYKQFGLPGHEGVDYGTPNGTPIIAPFNGVILRDTFGDKDYGNFTVIWDPVALCAVWFCHLQDTTTQSGDKVVSGQLLGHTNNTGNSSGPHCHVNFVETDSLGNRLNKTNSYQGFMNILDPDLVTIQDHAIIPQPITQASVEITDQTKIPQIGNMEVQAIRSTMNDQQNQINNLSAQLAQVQHDLVTAKQVISDLQNQLTARVVSPGVEVGQASIQDIPQELPVPTTSATSFWGWLRKLLGI